jgi:hypothetical protein
MAEKLCDLLKNGGVPFIGDNKEVISTSTQTYTATRSGWILVRASNPDVTTNVYLQLLLSNGYQTRQYSIPGFQAVLSMPMRKGQQVTINTNGGSVIQEISFYY